ncbi:hypothetical protein [Burkholderia vietnamiensis]|uniref:hypothetical protein n=1 Tax=Burkholderia vietnamiensis TaxID=60552 RepID=UPI001FC84EBA|nr:hypothetical protein [Burkholderia vietnamiensis]
MNARVGEDHQQLRVLGAGQLGPIEINPRLGADYLAVQTELAGKILPSQVGRLQSVIRTLQHAIEEVGTG